MRPLVVEQEINQRQPVPPGDRRHWHGVPAHDPERDDETDPGHKYRRFKVVAPSRLEVTSSVPAELKLAHGEHEAIGVEAKWLQDSQECRMHWTDQYVSIDIRDRTATASTSAPEARPPKAQHSHTVASITAWIPERYCSVHASTAGGDIQLQGLTEAALQLRTGQGSVSVGKVRASTVDIQCSGGQVTGSIVADKVQLRLMDGGAKLERLMGNYVDVLHSHSDQAAPAAQSRRADGSQLGPIDAKMVHINRELTMVSEGGAINIGTLNCQEVDQAKLALIRSQGGDISVTGLDGKADLQSNGGDVKVQLHEGAAHVVVNSGCGDIECCVPPVVRADLRLTTPTLHLPDDLTFEKDAVASDEGLHAIGQIRSAGVVLAKNNAVRALASRPASTKPVVWVVFYSMYGHIYRLAQEEAKGAESEGVEVKMFQVQETLSETILGKMHAPPKPDIPIVDPNSLTDADGILFGFPTRFGAPPAQFKAMTDATGQLWVKNALFGKPFGCFTSTNSQGGGQEATIINSLSNFVHHGMIFVPPGYAAGDFMADVDEVRGGSAWGAGTFAGPKGERQPTEKELKLAHFQGAAFAKTVKALCAGRSIV
ncbi:hypothetical protein WJX72_010364 [[Myrmecia] bisecta]|uniref:NAD(P)H dehydrogenase (quinone) n=1 Tax=[Myrmecia] bisecta TaxID=41462 RepID=A0AAW1PBQ7_9CHLO